MGRMTYEEAAKTIGEILRRDADSHDTFFEVLCDKYRHALQAALHALADKKKFMTPLPGGFRKARARGERRFF